MLAKDLRAALQLATVAAGALATLAKEHVVNQITIAEEGGIPPLLELLRDASPASHARARSSVPAASLHRAVSACDWMHDSSRALVSAGSVVGSPAAECKKDMCGRTSWQWHACCSVTDWDISMQP